MKALAGSLQHHKIAPCVGCAVRTSRLKSAQVRRAALRNVNIATRSVSVQVSELNTLSGNPTFLHSQEPVDADAPVNTFLDGSVVHKLENDVIGAASAAADVVPEQLATVTAAVSGLTSAVADLSVETDTTVNETPSEEPDTTVSDTPSEPQEVTDAATATVAQTLANEQKTSSDDAVVHTASAVATAVQEEMKASASARPEPPAVKQAEHPRNIVFVTAEVAPWSKTGGLGDVCGSLPQALVARGHRVMVVVPRYANYPDAFDTQKRISILGAEVGYFHAIKHGVDYVFIDHPCYPRPGGIYSDANGDYGDNQFRYMLLCLAALEAPLQLPLGERGLFGQECVFLANDWHAALVPVYLAAKYRPHGVYTAARCVLAIHNLRHQGVFPPYTYDSLGLPGQWYGALEYQYPPHQRLGSYAEEGRSVNHLKAGIVTADRILTVSPGYASEIKTYLGGWGMEGILTSREYVLNGIVNGIDMMEWNPSCDPHIEHHYDTENFVEGKKANKLALQKELGLPVNENIPLVAFIGRLDFQKGADVIMEAVPWIMEQNVQLVCLGSGNKDLENGLRWMEATYRDKARGWVGFNVGLSHRLTAAADILLMPSRFEPCGLNQLYAMRYGAVPVAHKTGGLKDTVISYDPWSDKGTGWVFDNCDAQGLTYGLGHAINTLRRNEAEFRKLQLRGMTQDYSWDTAASQYEQVFDWACFDKPFCNPF